MTADTCTLCGHRYGPGLLTRVCIDGDWVWECIDCRDCRRGGTP